MTETGKILLEAICAISVMLCLVYIVLLIKKRMTDNPMPFSSILIEKRAVTVVYDDNEILMWLYFYTEGFVLEKGDGKRMCIPIKNVVSLKEETYVEGEKYSYILEFDPEISEKDTVKVLSVDSISHLFSKTLPEEKIIKE